MGNDETTGLLTAAQREALERVGVDGRVTTWYDVLTAIGVTTRGFDAAADLRRRFLDADDRARALIAAAEARGREKERALVPKVVRDAVEEEARRLLNAAIANPRLSREQRASNALRHDELMAWLTTPHRRRDRWQLVKM